MDAREIKTHMASLEQAKSTDKIHEILAIFEKRVRATEELLRVCLVSFWHYCEASHFATLRRHGVCAEMKQTFDTDIRKPN
jgi:hypothetical protein